MDKKVEGENEGVKKEKHEFHSFYDVARRMMLAAIGAVALKHDEMQEFIDKLVERGEIARKDGEDLMKEMRERHKKYHPDEESYAHKRVTEFMEHFSVPTKNDFDALTDKLTALEKKIDELTKTKKSN